MPVLDNEVSSGRSSGWGKVSAAAEHRAKRTMTLSSFLRPVRLMSEIEASFCAVEGPGSVVATVVTHPHALRVESRVEDLAFIQSRAPR